MNEFKLNPMIDEKDMPVPRLELRYEKVGETWDRMLYKYALVLPLREYDMRGQDENGVYVRNTITIIINEVPEHDGHYPIYTNPSETYILPPYRDGRHAMWDATCIGMPPVYVVCDGKAQLYNNNEKPAPQAVLEKDVGDYDGGFLGHSNDNC